MQKDELNMENVSFDLIKNFLETMTKLGVKPYHLSKSLINGEYAWKIAQCIIRNSFETIYSVDNDLLKIVDFERYFGPTDWLRYFGEMSNDEIAFPVALDKFKKIAEEDCPFIPGKKRKDTHFLFYTPDKVNGQKISCRFWRDMIGTPAVKARDVQGRYLMNDFRDNKEFYHSKSHRFFNDQSWDKYNYYEFYDHSELVGVWSFVFLGSSIEFHKNSSLYVFSTTCEIATMSYLSFMKVGEGSDPRCLTGQTSDFGQGEKGGRLEISPSSPDFRLNFKDRSQRYFLKYNLQT